MKSHLFATAVFAFSILAATGLDAETTPADFDADHTLASGHGVEVTRQDLENELRLLPEDRRKEVLENPDAAQDLINQMYFRGRMAVLAEELGYTDEALVQARMKRLHERLFRELVPRRYVETIELPDLSEAAREFYDANPEEFMQREEVHAAHILLRAPDPEDKERRRDEAEGLLQKLNDGARFADLAREHGEDGSSQIGGDLGFFTRDRMVEEFSDAVFAMEPGDIDLVETRFGFHLVELRDRQGGEPRPFEDVEERIKDRLRAEYIEEELTSYLTSVASPRDAEIDTDAVIATVREAAEALDDESGDDGATMPSIPVQE